MCSQLHREVARWQGEGEETDECGPDLRGVLELTPVGGHRLLVRRRWSNSDEFWQLDPDGAIGGAPIGAPRLDGSDRAGFTFLPGPEARVLAYNPRSPQWTLYHVQGSVAAQSHILGAAESGVWGPADWKSADASPIGRQFLGLEDGFVLDRDLGSGGVRVWRFVLGPNGTTQIQRPVQLDAPARDDFRRGHRLVHLAPNRLLEWTPRTCDAAAGPCAGAKFHIWRYTLDNAAGPSITFDETTVVSGEWPDIGAGHSIVADDAHLFVLTRASGELRAYPLDPEVGDPLTAPVRSSSPDARLVSLDWMPPTRSPAIKHLVLLLQDGRSFDAYFGRFCQGEASAGGAPLACDQGPACCDRIPADLPGASSCASLDASSSAYRPDDTPDCLRSKMNGGAMDGFVRAPAAGGCGGPNDFACGGPTDGGGALAGYHLLASRGALADRFFQSYAFLGGQGAAPDPSPSIQNYLYLVTARFPGADLGALFDTPLITAELARQQVPWAVYAGHKNLMAMVLFGIPLFNDPDWSPYRSLEGQELEHDIATGQLPSVAVVLPDRDDPVRSEAPGNPVGPGITYVQRLVDTLGRSPYRDDTLVLLAFLTAGGYYDHVAPPAAPPPEVDASSGSPSDWRPVEYGPRVPLLALGRFAQRGHVSHVQLEMTSISLFIEWNWLRGNGLKRLRAVADRRRYRDTIVNNLGSLLDAAETGVEVPAGHN